MPHAIPFTTYDLDRAEDRRADPGWIAERADAETALYAALWRGKPLMTGDGAEWRVSWLSASDVATIRSENIPSVFLGVDQQGQPRFALDVSALEGPEPTGPLSGHGRFEDLRMAAVGLAAGEAGVMAQAKSLLDWHARHRFCAVCGTPTDMRYGGARRVCPNCGAEHFPRVDPVVIVLVSHGERVLLGRGPQWPKGFFSALAGFVEQGETIEAAAIREVREETGVLIGQVRIVANQPWPWPSSLMIGCTATAETTDINVDGVEIEQARWFERRDVERMLRGDGPGKTSAPPSVAIAHHLIRAWLGLTDATPDDL